MFNHSNTNIKKYDRFQSIIRRKQTTQILIVAMLIYKIKVFWIDSPFLDKIL
jgi:hypothetical protein